MKINHIIDNIIKETNVNIITNEETKDDYRYLSNILSLATKSIMGKDYDENKEVKINDIDIIYFETCGREVCFITTDNKLLNIKISMKKLETVLSNRNYFLKISKSIIINVSHIVEVNYYKNMRFQITLTNGYKQVVNRSYFSDFKKCIEEVYNQ